MSSYYNGLVVAFKEPMSEVSAIDLAKAIQWMSGVADVQLAVESDAKMHIVRMALKHKYRQELLDFLEKNFR